MKIIKLYFIREFKNDNCNCNETIIFKFKQKHLTDIQKISLLCPYHMIRHISNIFVEFKNADGHTAKQIEDVTSVIISQQLEDSDRKDIEREHYSKWKNIVDKRSQEISSLKNDRQQIINSLDSDEEKIDGNKLVEEIGLIGEQIKNHNKEIIDIQNSSSELSYKEYKYVTSLELACNEYDKFTVESTSGIREIEYEVVWNFCDKISKKSSMKRKIISEETCTIKVPKIIK